MVTLNWELFKNTYIRPLLNDVLDESYEGSTLEATAYTTIVDMTSKGIPNLSPQPSSSSIAGLSQVNYIEVSSAIKAGNIFYVFIDDQSESYTAVTNDTVTQVLAGLTTAINNSVKTSFANITATNQTLRIKIEGSVSTPFIIDASAIQGQGNTNNPTIALTLGRSATDAKQITTAITTLEADTTTAFNVLAYGIRYFLTADPITRLSTTSGLQITKDENLVEIARGDYYSGILAYLEANDVSNSTADYWRTKLAASISANANQTGLTYEQQLALLNAEYDRKIQQDDNSIMDTGSQQRLAQDNNTRNQKSILALKHQWDLEREFRSLNNRQATNGYWTPAGQFTVSFLSEYDVTYEDTITVDLLKAPNSYFGLAYVINNAETLQGSIIEVSKYTKLDLTITADYNIQFKLFSSLDRVTFTQVGTTTTDTQIVKEYYLPPTKFIRLDVIGTVNNTNFYIEGNLRA